jgi:nucleotide-binding universal stress UspA family protein
MFKHILIPTDGSTLSKKAIKRGIALAKSARARVTGFYAAPQFRIEIYGEYVPRNIVTPDQHRVAMKKRAQKYLAVIEKAADAARVRYRGHYVLSDFPYEAIIQAAKGKGCDLIFMASHGRRGLSGLLLGSETTKVLTHSKIPVLVYR